MPRLHALELLPDPDGEASVRRDWQALRDAGLPSMLDHAGSTNTPHLTLVSAPAVDADDEQLAVDLLDELLPSGAGASGLAVFGTERLTLVRTLDVDDALVGAVLEMRRRIPRLAQRQAWLAHLTVARRLPRADLQRAVDALDPEGFELDLVSLRRWDPDAGEVRTLGSS